MLIAFSYFLPQSFVFSDRCSCFQSHKSKEFIFFKPKRKNDTSFVKLDTMICIKLVLRNFRTRSLNLSRLLSPDIEFNYCSNK